MLHLRHERRDTGSDIDRMLSTVLIAASPRNAPPGILDTIPVGAAARHDAAIVAAAKEERAARRP
jgi:hypothetical protein